MEKNMNLLGWEATKKKLKVTKMLMFSLYYYG